MADSGSAATAVIYGEYRKSTDGVATKLQKMHKG